MQEKRFFWQLVLVGLLLLSVSISSFAQETESEEEVDYDYHTRHPNIIYGNDPALANNIVMMVDDNVYEANIRYWFELFEANGIKATFFPHTAYMLNQDPQLWRDIVAAGHE